MKLRILFFLVLGFFSLYSQSPIFFGFRTKYGFIVPHHSEIRYLIDRHIHSYDLRLGVQTSGNKQWQFQWNYPDLGVGFYHTYLGKFLGSSTALYGYINLPIKRYKNYTFLMDYSLGCAYLSKPWGVDGSLNFAIGSHYNIFADLGFLNRFNFNNVSVAVGLDWTHFSNGGTKAPNLGLNVFGLAFQANYFLHYTQRKSKYSHKRYRIKSDITVFGSWGKQQHMVVEPQFDVYNITAEAGFLYSPKSKIISGIDFTYNKRVEFNGDSSFKALKIAPFAAYAAVFGSVEFIFKQAVILKNVSPDIIPREFIYQVYGLRMEVYRGFMLMLTLKTRWFNAQNIRFGIGYRLHLGKKQRF